MTARGLALLRRFGLIAATVMGAASVTGCENPFNPPVAPRRGVYVAPPSPSSAEGVVRLFEWCWDNRGIEEYEEIFTEDFEFQFAATDEAGDAFGGLPLNRFQEIEIARHLFVGGGASPPANSITLSLGQSLLPSDDLRPGKHQTFHRMIDTDVVLYIDTDEEDFNVTGRARFFLVRGDSAKIPEDLVARGHQPDPGRWYIERWEDETVGSAGAYSALLDRRGSSLAARPSRVRGPEPPGRSAAGTEPLPVTWGFVKAAYFPHR